MFFSAIVPSQRHLHDIFCQLHPILIVPIGLADLRLVSYMRSEETIKLYQADELRKPMMSNDVWVNTPFWLSAKGSEISATSTAIFKLPSLHQSVAERSPELQPGFNSAALAVAMAKLVYISHRIHVWYIC